MRRDDGVCEVENELLATRQKVFGGRLQRLHNSD